MVSLNRFFHSAVFLSLTIIPFGLARAQASFADDVQIYGGAATTVQWGDLDKDGLQDMFIAEGGRHSNGDTVLSWFKAPNWIEYSIGPDLTAFTGDSAVVDVDGDGHLDIIVPRDDHSNLTPAGSMQWYKNPGNLQTTPNQNWVKYIIEAEVPDAFHQGDLEVADVDNDGKLDIVVRSLGINRFVIYFQNTATSNAASAWTKVRIDAPDPREGLVIADLDGNNKVDIIGNGYILFAPTNPRDCNDPNPGDGVDRCMATWTTTTFDANFYNATQSGLNNSTKGEVYDMDGDGRLDILQSSAEGNDTYLAWYKNPSNAQTGNWAKNIIEDPQGKNHNVQVGDIDLDGDVDVLGGFSFGDNGVYWWENVNGLATSWARHEIEGSNGCYSCVAADFDNDGDVDFAGPTRYVNEVYLYENTTADNSDALAIAPQTMQFSEGGGSQTLNITSDVAWTASSNQGWLTISSNGEDTGADITVTSAARSASDFGSRTATVTVNNGISRNLSISQDGANDDITPSVPSNVTASNISYDSLQLDWNVSTDNSNTVTEYIIYLNGSEFDRAATNTIALTGLTESTVYSVRISAVDPSGNESAQSSAINATTTSRPPSPPPVAHWKFDETTGSVADDSAPANNDGTLTGMETDQWDSSNALLGTAALRFDGGAERVDLGTMNAPTTAITLIGWIKPTNIDSNNGEGRIISKASGSSANEHYWMLSTDENGSTIVPRVRLKVNGTTRTLVANTSTVVSNGVWSQIVATYDGSIITLYHNGENVGSVAASGTIDQSSASAVIGNQPAGDRGFEGLIDDVCLFDYAISEQDVEYLYNTGQGRVCDTLVSGSNPDVTAPIVIEVTPVTTPTTETSPGYTYNTSEAGTVAYGGSCSSTPSSAVAAGDISISFAELSYGTYSDCSVTVTDAANNVSDVLLISSFTIIEPDTTKPTVTVNQASGQADPTDSNIANFTAVFSEPIELNSFTANDISLTAGNVTVGPNQLSDTEFSFSVTGMTNGDVVTVTIAANRVKDLADNDNEASTHTDNSVTYVCNNCTIDDEDLDGIDASEDNCPTMANADQADLNSNGVGDVCENNELCFPILASNGAVGLICL